MSRAEEMERIYREMPTDEWKEEVERLRVLAEAVMENEVTLEEGTEESNLLIDQWTAMSAVLIDPSG